MSNQISKSITPRANVRKSAAVVAYTDKARDLIFDGQSIVALAAAASGNQEELQEWELERALGIAYKLLDDAAAMLDPIHAARLAIGEVPHV